MQHRSQKANKPEPKVQKFPAMWILLILKEEKKWISYLREQNIATSLLNQICTLVRANILQ